MWSRIFFVNRNVKIKLFWVGSDLLFNVLLKTDQMKFSPRVGSTEGARGVGVHFLLSSGPKNKEIKHEHCPQEQDNDGVMEKEGGGGDGAEGYIFFLFVRY